MKITSQAGSNATEKAGLEMKEKGRVLHLKGYTNYSAFISFQGLVPSEPQAGNQTLHHLLVTKSDLKETMVNRLKLALKSRY